MSTPAAAETYHPQGPVHQQVIEESLQEVNIDTHDWFEYRDLFSKARDDAEMVRSRPSSSKSPRTAEDAIDGPSTGGDLADVNLLRQAESLESSSSKQSQHSSFPKLDTSPPASWPVNQVDPGARRPNPKLALVRPSQYQRDSSASFITPRVSRSGINTPNEEWSAQLSNGTHLYAISHTAPYLLGTKRYISGLEALSSLKSAPVVPKDDHGNDMFDGRRITPRDTALLTIMTYAEQDPSTRSPIIEHWLSSFSFEENKLHCYRDAAPNPPTECTITLNELALQYHDWQYSDNFFTLGADNSLLIPRWATNLDLLRTRSIAVEYITISHFRDLTTTALTSADTEIKIAALEQSIQNGTLQRSLPLPSSSTSHTRRGRAFTSQVFEYISPDTRNPKTLYAHRFSHANPTGEMQKLDVGRRKYDGWYDGEKQNTIHKHSVRAAIKEGKRRWRLSRWVLGIKWTVGVLAALGVVALVLVVCYFKIGQKRGDGVMGE